VRAREQYRYQTLKRGILRERHGRASGLGAIRHTLFPCIVRVWADGRAWRGVAAATGDGFFDIVKRDDLPGSAEPMDRRTNLRPDQT
jgi:hypothetical protein